MRASPDALRRCTRHRPMSMRFIPASWHYISGQFSIQTPRKPQKSAISAPRPTPKLFKFSHALSLRDRAADGRAPTGPRGACRSGRARSPVAVPGQSCGSVREICHRCGAPKRLWPSAKSPTTQALNIRPQRTSYRGYHFLVCGRDQFATIYIYRIQILYVLRERRSATARRNFSTSVRRFFECVAKSATTMEDPDDYRDIYKFLPVFRLYPGWKRNECCCFPLPIQSASSR